jgi:phosphohistidine phosphatase
MKTLYLLRHAKSSWDDPGLDDHDRPLAPRGRKAAKKLAAHLRAAGVAPELVLCSSSRRTRETLELVRAALNDAEIRFDDALYGASEGLLLERVRSVDPRVQSLLVVGHNPGLQAFGLELAGGGVEQARSRLHEKMPTGALATLSFAAESWAGVEPGSGELVDFVVPRDLT